MSYRIAGIDVHKKMLAVVVSDVEIESEYQFERRMFSSNPEQLRSLAAWLVEQEAEEVVMESTAQYWKPVWEALERYFGFCQTLSLLKKLDKWIRRRLRSMIWKQWKRGKQRY